MGIFENLSFTALYDAGNRVTGYNRKDAYPGARETQSWIYDGAGNWNSTTIDGNAQSRSHSASDQLETIAGDNLTYDPRGNQLTDNRGNEYTWDLDNRIVQSEGSGYTDIEYRYDALGRRIVRKQGTNKEVLLWWNNTEQSEHKHQAGQTTIQNDLQANPSEQALNTIFARTLEGDKQDIQYLHKNYLDHVMAVSDDNGNLIEHYRYAAFGEPEIYSPTGTRLAATAIDNDILWNVRRYEAANGLYMYLYRDYDAPSGRCPSRDPIEEEGGINLYGFIGNDGLNLVDVLGLRQQSVDKCNAYIAVEHGSNDEDETIDWKFNSPCARGGMIGCFPDANNPENQRMPNVPTHNNLMAIMQGVDALANLDRDRLNTTNPNAPLGEETRDRPRPAHEHGIPMALDNATSNESVKDTMDDLCKCCDEVRFVIDVRGGDLLRGINNYSTRWKDRLHQGHNPYIISCSVAEPSLDPP